MLHGGHEPAERVADVRVGRVRDELVVVAPEERGLLLERRGPRAAARALERHRQLHRLAHRLVVAVLHRDQLQIVDPRRVHQRDRPAGRLCCLFS